MDSRGRNVCRQYASTGTCKYTNCKFSHETTPGGTGGAAAADRPKPLCTYFQRHGNCRFGAGCKFSHDLNAPAPVEDPNSAVSLYRGWNQLLGGARNRALGQRGGFSGYGSRAGTAELTSDQMEKFLEDAIRILEIGSIETVQQLIRELGSDRGLLRVQQIVQAEFALGYSPLGMSFKRHCIPFLNVLAHEELRASLVLEKEVGTLFNFIYGPGGQRGVGFFTRVVDSLVEASGSGNVELVEAGLYSAALALFNILNLNQSAAVQEEFKAIVRKLDTVCNSGRNSGTHVFRLAQQEIARIKVLLHIADKLPNTLKHQNAEIIPRSVDRHQVDFPGELSAEGPRHDNDNADIAKIKILPTSEEINSHRNEFLPQRSQEYPHHLEGISRMLDFQFRLLREDTSGQIREAVRAVMDNWDELTGEKDRTRDARKLKSKAHGVRTILYQNARVESMRCSNREGIILSASFDQPLKVQALKEPARKEWWERSKYLAVGSLLCLVDSLKKATFLVVCERKVLAKEYKRPNNGPVESTNMGPSEDLASGELRAWTTLRFAQTITEADIESVFQLSSNSLQVLVEFPGLLFASFDPVLKSLQQISKAGNSPFPQWLAPSSTFSYLPDPRLHQYVEVPPPLYMTKPGIKLDLSSITKGQMLTYYLGSDLRTEDLEHATTLDHGQSEALLASLSRELALIQGPPGTGKSYLGVQIVKVLLENRDKTEIGPIVCVCYTNHALDQFLEHLLDDGIKNIVRIGSRSKSPRVAALSLYEVTQNLERTPLEKYQLAKARDELLEVEKNIEAACKQLLQQSDAVTLKGFLESAYPRAYAEIFGEAEDDEGWMVVKKKIKGARRGVEQMFRDWIDGRFNPSQNGQKQFNRNRPLDQLRNESVLGMSRIERQRLQEYWYEEMKDKASENLLKAAEAHEQERNNITRQQQEQERRCLSKSHVIGLTTTGLASHANLIRSIKSKVLVCEEAAEVLEAHILTALLPTTEHAILIGDHLQLRPQIMKHEFSVENPRGGKAYGLNTSLFERAVEVERYGGKKFPVAKLDTQRRMHPSIADLIRNTLYPGLTDHHSTNTHPEVPGMARRLFWMDHRHPEASEDKLELIQTSHANEFEADMVVALVRHLSRQGVYKSGEIAVLSPYLRQLFILRSKLAHMFEVVIGERDQEQLDEAIESGELEGEPAVPVAAPGVVDRVVKKGTLLSEVRVATVDNFQGEEAKVIIISLVRSNKANKCGFLKTSNRINVLLSRAIDGMYIIGNAETCGQVGMWAKIITMLEKGKNIDKNLEIRCERHPEAPIFMAQPEDFHLLSPEGGCNERCQWRLDCGHPCVKKCHSQHLHKNTICLEPCNRSYKHCSHTCPKACGESCGNCTVKVAGVPLPCGHVPRSLKCYQLQDLALVRCTKLMERKIEACGHTVTMPCQQDPKTYRCNMRCGGLLPCGHECTSLCSSCTQRATTAGAGADNAEGNVTFTIHSPCRVVCGRKYTNCQHNCNKSCHGTEPCPACTQPCAIRCDHSRCGKKCSEPCAPCAERCNWSCKHRQRCDMPCAVPCNINPCSERCDKQLDCGHQCPSICGETCPDISFCQSCASEAILTRDVDLITFDSYADIDLDTDPIVVPSCGHFYTVSTYDSIMQMKTAYQIDDEGRILGPRLLDGSDIARGANEDPPDKLVIKNCPDCRAPLRDIHRYNRIVKVACLDESTKRFCTAAQANYLKIYKEVSDAQALLEANRSDFLHRLKQRATKRAIAADRLPVPIEDRIGRAKGMLKRISLFISTVIEEEQPYVRVRDLVLSQKRRAAAVDGQTPGTATSSDFILDSSAVQTGFRLKSILLYIDFRWETLWDLHSVSESDLTDAISRRKLRWLIMKEIPWVHRQCRDVVEECERANLTKYEVEARIAKARFWALWRIESEALAAGGEGVPGQAPHHANEGQPQAQRIPLDPFPPTQKDEEVTSLTRCSSLADSLPGTIGPLESKINSAKKLVRGGTFYEPVSNEEKEAVYLAMASQFTSTGRWYTCQNGHPFTIGDCGAPNQTSSCPECGASIGGGYTTGLASGVRRAEDFGELDRRLGRMRVS